MKKMTIAEFAMTEDVSNIVANGAVAYLVAKGVVTKTDEVKTATDENGKTKKGRPSAIFLFPDVVKLNY